MFFLMITPVIALITMLLLNVYVLPAVLLYLKILASLSALMLPLILFTK